MDSLRNNEKNRNTTEKELAVAKSRQKEKRKASKPVQDISSFFNQFRKPLQEINLNNRQQTKFATAETEATTLCGDANTSSMPKYASSERLSLPRRNASVVVREVPQRPSSYTSCSETQYSLKQSMEYPRSHRMMYHRASTTPESIKRSLEATGIFADTGIEDDRQHARSFTADIPRKERNPRHEPLEHSQEMSAVSETSFEDHASRNPASSSVSRRSGDMPIEGHETADLNGKSVNSSMAIALTILIRATSQLSRKTMELPDIIKLWSKSDLAMFGLSKAPSFNPTKIALS
jgi:hypothetical protein